MADDWSAVLASSSSSSTSTDPTSDPWSIDFDTGSDEGWLDDVVNWFGHRFGGSTATRVAPISAAQMQYTYSRMSTNEREVFWRLGRAYKSTLGPDLRMKNGEYGGWSYVAKEASGGSDGTVVGAERTFNAFAQTMVDKYGTVPVGWTPTAPTGPSELPSEPTDFPAPAAAPGSGPTARAAGGALLGVLLLGTAFLGRRND